MSVTAVRRSFVVIHHLMMNGEARFMDFAHVLAPISRTALSCLLASLKEIGELTQEGRYYRLAPTAAANNNRKQSVYTLPPEVRAQTHPILEQTAVELGHSCALFARVGTSTMKVMDVQNLPQPHFSFSREGDEFPLMPFHGFARLFLAHGGESAARDCYRFWLPYLQTNPNIRVPATEAQFLSELANVRRAGRALEYKDELQPIMRVAVPVMIPGWREHRFAVGLVANFVYLLQVESQVARLRETATRLAEILQQHIPASLFTPSADSNSPWALKHENDRHDGTVPWPTPGETPLPERALIAS